MNMQLIKLMVVFFQRTNFLSLQSLKKEISESLDIFSDSDEEFLHPAPQFREVAVSEEYSPTRLVSKSTPYIVTLTNDKIDFSTSQNFVSNDYDADIKNFILYAKKFTKISSSVENICGRIGVVNQSFVEYENPDEVINKKFFKGSISKNSVNININYTDRIKFGDLVLNKIDAVQPGTLNTSKARGIILQRDLNIDKMQIKIERDVLDKFLDESQKYICKSRMWTNNDAK